MEGRRGTITTFTFIYDLLFRYGNDLGSKHLQRFSNSVLHNDHCWLSVHTVVILQPIKKSPNSKRRGCPKTNIDLFPSGDEKIDRFSFPTALNPPTIASKLFSLRNITRIAVQVTLWPSFNYTQCHDFSFSICQEWSTVTQSLNH